MARTAYVLNEYKAPFILLFLNGFTIYNDVFVVLNDEVRVGDVFLPA